MRLSQVLVRPSAFLPLAMSLVALTTVAVHVAVHGTAPQPDEGAAAHFWQLLMAGQLPIIAWFGIRWLKEAPRAAAAVLTLQLVAVLAALAPVFLLGW